MNVNKKLAMLCLTTTLLVAAGCAQKAPEAPPPPPPEQNPFEQLQKLSSSIKTADGTGTARERCLAKQRTRLEGCGSKSGQERVVCEAVAKELISVCEQMDPEAPAFLAGLLFCSGTCPSRPCRAPGCPTPIGNCLGNICTSPPNTVCDPGILWDCVCATNVIGPPLLNTPFCSCNCE